jgi:iron complex outermembrane recepter protein
MKIPRPSRLFLSTALLFCAGHAGIGMAADLTERDYFSELPEVLTVTRLAQPLSETPGAVTIIDRDKIRRSGARELADVLRLVPGYLVSGWNGANPNAVYHAPLDDFGTRNLVLIDGRAVYSSMQLGDTHRGMMGLLLEDIERVEVLRGSNSAAYGANALFGVINIVTRHAADTRGGMATVSGGGAGIRDGMVRLGWGGENADFRLSAGQRSDTGYRNAHDDKKLSQVHFRGDLRPDSENEIRFSAGAIALSTDEGFAGNLTNAERTNHADSFYLHGVWQRNLSGTDSLRLNVSYDAEKFYDYSAFDMALLGCGAFPFCVGPFKLDYRGTGRRLNIDFQHTVGLKPGLRAVWGVTAKREEADSPPLYRVPVAFNRFQLFGNLEWQPIAGLHINAGGLWERHSEIGSTFAPRLAANLSVAPGHTLRVAATRGFRTPSLYELKADTRYYNSRGELVGITHLAKGEAKAETLDVIELGYLAEIHALNTTLDVRAFDERLVGTVSTSRYRLPAALPVTGSRVRDFINRRDARIQGLDYQLRWKPWSNTELWINQSWQRFVWGDEWDNHLPPHRTTTLALFQKLPANLDLSVMYHSTSPVTWRGDEDILPTTHRLDLRLAYPFQIGGTRAEAALTVQAANGDVPEFQATENFKFARRAFGTLRIEF